tara:strand:- start:2320 stop:2616 length:297 start_codon:yes stop_codon:yes gene_type:complete
VLELLAKIAELALMEQIRLVVIVQRQQRIPLGYLDGLERRAKTTLTSALLERTTATRTQCVETLTVISRVFAVQITTVTVPAVLLKIVRLEQLLTHGQ